MVATGCWTTTKLRQVPWRAMSVEYLRRDRYDPALLQQLMGAPVVSATDARNSRFPHADAVRVEYHGLGAGSGFEGVARTLGIMDNIKAGVPRVAYHGVVTVRLGNTKQLVHVTPPLDQTGL